MITRHKPSADTFVREDATARNYDGRAALVLAGNAGARRRALLFFPGVPRRGVLISATLEVYLRGAWSGGPHTITVRNIDGKWEEDRVRWSNAPAVRTTPSATAAVTGGVGGQRVDINVTTLIAEIVGGAKWYGFRLELDTTGLKELHSTDNADPDLRARLVLSWSEGPEAPTDLRPQSGAVVSASPIVSWSYRDPQGDEQGAYRIRISTAATVGADGILTTTEFDSGWVTSGTAEADLAALGYTITPAATNKYWQVQVRDVNGHESKASDVYVMQRKAKGTLAISSPANGSTSNDRTPPITSTLTGAAQKMIAYRLEEATGDADNPWREIWPFSPHAAAAAAGVAYTEHVPDGLIKRTDRNYRLTVRSWDADARESLPGDPAYVEASSTFGYDPHAATTGAAGTAASVLGPAVALTWTRATQPDAWIIRAKVNGSSPERELVERIEGADASAGGTSYAWRWYGAKPRTLYDVEVAAVVESGAQTLMAATNPVVTARTTPIGIYLADVVGQRHVQILGTDAADLELGESGETLFPIGGEPVRIVDSVRGLEGSISGTVHTAADRTLFEELVRESVRRPGRVRLILANVNVPVICGEPVTQPTPTPSGDDWIVSCAVWQQGEFTSEAP